MRNPFRRLFPEKKPIVVTTHNKPCCTVKEPLTETEKKFEQLVDKLISGIEKHSWKKNNSTVMFDSYDLEVGEHKIRLSRCLVTPNDIIIRYTRPPHVIDYQLIECKLFQNKLKELWNGIKIKFSSANDRELDKLMEYLDKL